MPNTTFLDPQNRTVDHETEGNPPCQTKAPPIHDILRLTRFRFRMGRQEPVAYVQADGVRFQIGRPTSGRSRSSLTSAPGLLHYGFEEGDGVAFMPPAPADWDACSTRQSRQARDRRQPPRLYVYLAI